MSLITLAPLQSIPFVISERTLDFTVACYTQDLLQSNSSHAKRLYVSFSEATTLLSLFFPAFSSRFTRSTLDTYAKEIGHPSFNVNLHIEDPISTGGMKRQRQKMYSLSSVIGTLDVNSIDIHSHLYASRLSSIRILLQQSELPMEILVDETALMEGKID